MPQPARRIDLKRGLAALRDLAANPEDLPKVFTVIEALSGGTLLRTTKRLRTSERGRQLLAEQPDIVARLADRAGLAQLPAGTLGRAYLDFVESENISADGIRAAARQGRSRELPPPYDYVHGRMRDTHDLWHAAVGYRGDVLGEVALLAFTLAQTRNPGIALIVGVGLLKTIGSRADAFDVIIDGYQRGRKAAWFPEQHWESLLDLPVAEVRARLSLEAPPAYTEVRSADLRAQRFAPV